MPAICRVGTDCRIAPPVFHPSHEDLSLGTPSFHPSDEDLSLGTPSFHPSDEDLSLGTPALPSRPYLPKITRKNAPLRTRAASTRECNMRRHGRLPPKLRRLNCLPLY